MSERPQKKKRFRSVSIYWLLPNILTVAGFASGLTALRFAMDGRWAGVIVLISVAAVFDALDGRTARRFQTSSAFGAALDSLSDLVVFGVVPALCLYIWALQDAGTMAWWATLFYAVSIADLDGIASTNLTWEASSDGRNWEAVPVIIPKSLPLIQGLVGKQIRLRVSVVDTFGVESILFSKSSLAVRNVNNKPAGKIIVRRVGS
jgi:hypothetical protein